VFADIAEKALTLVSMKDVLLTLGVMPTRPDTGYGYIQFLEDVNENGAFKVKTFVEKPTLEIAKTFYQSGDFLWNAGIFVANVKSWVRAFHHYMPEMNELFTDGKKFYNTPKEKSFITKIYAQCPNTSIDIGVMEKAKNVLVIPAKFGWTDLGTWASLYGMYEKDYVGNAVSGKNVMIYDSNNCMVLVPDNKLVVLQGLEDYIVVDTEDVLLVCEKNREQEIKQIVADIKRQKGEKFL
jgi:mannose-1-phosphate guanylyltransferase